MRYRLRTLLLVSSLLCIAFGVTAIPIAWQLTVTHPGIRFPGLPACAAFSFFGGLIGLISWIVLAIGAS